MKIVSNTVVHNEENYIWYALMSAAPYVDKMMVWDTGSTDNTVKIIEEVKKIYKQKLEFRQVGHVNKYRFTDMRQKMLDESKGDWILILDGDEIWSGESLKKLTRIIRSKGNSLDAIVVPFYNAVGDLYHFQDKSAGKYRILGRIGHLTIRAINKKIPGLHLDNPYGSEGYFDNNNTPIQNRDSKRLLVLEAPFIHVTHLNRSSKSQSINKYKYELGERVPKDFKYPEVLSHSRPSIVSDPWRKRSSGFIFRSAIVEPKRIIRKAISKTT